MLAEFPAHAKSHITGFQSGNGPFRFWPKAPKLGAKTPKKEDTPSTKPVEDKADDAKEQISLKDNDASEKVQQAGDTSVADTSELSEADPQPIADSDDEETVPGSKEAAKDEGTDDDDGLTPGDTEDAAEEAGDEASNKGSSALGGLKSAAGGLGKGVSGLVGKGKDAAGGAADKASKGDVTGAATGAKDDIQEGAEDAAEDVQDGAEKTQGDVTESAADGAEDRDTYDVPQVSDRLFGGKGSGEGATDKASGALEGAKDTVEDTAEGAKETAEDAAEDPQATAEDAAQGAKDTAEDAVDGAKDTAEDAADGVKETAEDAAEGADAEGVKDTAEDAVDGAKDTAEDAAGQVADLSMLKGLKVDKGGDILDSDGNAIGKLAEGDPEDLEGYEVGDDGEILDEDGDVIGRVDLTDKAQELAGQAKDTAEDAAEDAQDTAEDAVDEAKEGVETYLPDLDVLKGLEVQENGEILDKEGNVLGKITEGDPADLVGMTLNENGEVLDEDGDAIGRAETLPQEVKKEAEGELPGLDALEGLKVGEGGEIKDADGNLLGKITEGDPADLQGLEVTKDGEVLDEDGDVIGRAEIVPEAADALGEAGEGVQPEALKEALAKVEDIEEQLKPNLMIVEGRKLNKKGNILDDEGEVLAKLVEGDAKECAGKVPNENGEILDDDGNVIGKVEVVEGEAADEAMKELNPELVGQLEEAQQAVEEAEKEAEGAADEAKDAAEEAKEAADEAKPDFSQLEGLKVNKKGEVVNEDGDPIAKLSEGYDLEQVRGKKINENGEILDAEGNVIGKVEFLQSAIDDGVVKMEEVADEASKQDTTILEGLKVNKKGFVLDEEGEQIAKLVEGELEDCAGKKLNDKGEVLDKEGNVIGKVELIPQEGEEEGEPEEEDDDRPPVSILEGLKVNKTGKIVDSDGNIVGELVEGDAKKLWKSGSTCDAEGKFWDNKGNVIGRAETVAREDKEDEAQFAGLEGLVVVADGWVEDENGNRVGKVVEGDPKKLVGRSVDEDGDILDKRGNAVGHAERYEEPDAEPEEEAAPIDLSEMKGLKLNKHGNVIGPDGVPIGRLVEGNAKELAGRRVDGEGKIWDDTGKVVGRVELIPPQDREAKPEGIFGGLEGLHVVKDGWVEDGEGNRVGKVVDGDPKKLVGQKVDEDGDIIDKNGDVKGHAEPWEEEEEAPEDLSSLEGKTVNKQGKVVDEHGTIFGEVIEGDVKRLVGCKVDGKGQIWSNDGKVIGKAGVIAGGEKSADGPFSGFEVTSVQKDGTVVNGSGDIIGRITEGEVTKLVGRKVDDDGDISDKNGNVIGHAERWEPEEKEREVSPMSGLKVNKEGEVRDTNGDVIGRLTEGQLTSCVGKTIDDNGHVVDQDGNKLGEVTLLENIPEEEEQGMTEEEEEEEIAKKIGNIINQTLEKMEPICKDITDLVEKADRTPKEELDEEKLVNDVKPKIEEGSRILGECNGAIRGLDPDGHIAAQAKAKAASGEASPAQHRVAEGLKELTSTVVKTIDNAKKRISDMPHAKKKLNPLWGLLTEPLFQIIAAVGLLLSGVLGLVGKLLNALGLGGLVNGILGGLGVDKLLGGLGLGSIGESLGLGGGKKK
ncbi:uncharacterized protein AB675_7866 [Cyphellophora attinorum]|uniref:DUF6987 domain-containing protein n=1 Tax=Cyphellophora attinorum TaxID=1664694 RepID=A0A0N1HVB4_9EURO|nr:uncharacterized protein AB675_7866 [Phialophora attinorum]KPI41174.1 hypothetical protein AB675_7866 [Phialophora attinorum]